MMHKASWPHLTKLIDDAKLLAETIRKVNSFHLLFALCVMLVQSILF